MKHLKPMNENSNLYDRNGVYIEPVASASDFSKFIDHHSDELGFNSREFWKSMEMWEEGTLSSRFDPAWCQEVISGKAGSFWEKKRKYYPAIVKLMEDYELKTIRFAMDW
jgi:hypothetical protein